MKGGGEGRGVMHEGAGREGQEPGGDVKEEVGALHEQASRDVNMNVHV